MQYAPLGNSGLRVSRVTIGGLTFGNKLLGDDATRAIHEAIDHGVNSFDTAESYNDGESERLIGAALAQDGRRDNVYIATKVYTPRAAGGKAARNSRANILESIEGSLSRLMTDHVDLYQAHHPDPDTPWEETFDTFDALVKSGKVRHIGLCNHYGWHLGFLLSELRQRGWTTFASCQHAYSILDRQVEQEIIPFCQTFGRGLMAYEPFAQGLLTGIYRAGSPPPPGARENNRVNGYLADAGIRRILSALPAIAQRSGLAMNQLAILWLLSKPYLTTAILGGDRPEHFRSIYEIIDRRLGNDIVREIDELSEARVYAPYPNQPERGGPKIGR